MPGSLFGRILSITTFGESHGPAIGVVVDGAPPGLAVAAEDIQKELDRRRPGQSAVTTPRAEKDKVEILSGIFDGVTTGVPIALLIRNEDKRSSDYENLKDLIRPGHADWTYGAKYGVRDWRGSGRASGRETAARVAAGAIAKKILAARGVAILGYSREIAGVRAESVDPAEIERNMVRSPDAEAALQMIARIEQAKADGDSVGGIVEVVASGCPAGLGDPVFDKLEALLAHAVMSVGAARGVEVGAGFEAARMRRVAVQRPALQRGRTHEDAHEQRGGHCGGHLQQYGQRGACRDAAAGLHLPSAAVHRCQRAAGDGAHRGPPRPLHRAARGARAGGDGRPGARRLPAAPAGLPFPLTPRRRGY